MDDFQASMLEIFVFETNGFLEALEKILLECEGDEQGIRTSVPEIFRIMHTIKSSSAMMSLDNISKLAHAVEDVFFYIRENNPEHVDNGKLVDIVLGCIDFIRSNMDGVAKDDPDEIIAFVKALLEEIKSPSGQTASPPDNKPEQPADEPEAAQSEGNIHLTVTFKEDCQMLGLRAFELQSKVARSVDKLDTVPADPTEDEGQVRKNGLILNITTVKTVDELTELILKSPYVSGVSETAAKEPAPEKSVSDAPVPAEPNPEEKRQFSERRQDSTQTGGAIANVAVSKLDFLVDLVGELLVAEMELSRVIETDDREACEASASTMKKLILQMQEAALSTRMIPVKETFHKLNRLIRDMCRKLDKDIQFITSGEDTEVDRSMIDNIFSPLMHITRNSIDHGIEPADEREAAGKPRGGKVELSAYTEGRDVIFKVKDDGRGLNRDKILEKAIAQGLVSPERAPHLTDEEINGFILFPGFSTNSEVTEFSGRGVGMDVVNENMKKMNGKITVRSTPGKGTRITLKIPLTMAIIDAIVVSVNGESCVVPLGSVSEVVRVTEELPVREVNGGDTVLLRDKCFRIVNLCDFFGAAGKPDYTNGVLLVVKSESDDFALFANGVVDRLSVVVKPVPAIFKSIRGISGCTILGDGKISLILDAGELYNRKAVIK